MKRIFGIIYPVAVYMGIAFINSYAYMGLLIILLTGKAFINGMGADFTYLAMQIEEKAFEIYNNSILYVTFMGAVMAAPVLYWFFKRDNIKRGVKSTISLKIPNNFNYIVLLGIGACIAGNNLIALSGIAAYFQDYEEIAESMYSNGMFFQFISIGVIIPLTEELVFRGLIFKRMRDWMGFTAAAVLSAAGFALFHGNIVQGIYAFFLGMLMAYVYEKYETFLAPYLLHATANILSVIISSTELGLMMYANISTVLLLTIASVMMVVTNVKRIEAEIRNDKKI